jgi:hypothetical protein
LMFVNLAVLIRFVFYPFFTVNGHVRPLMINLSSIQPIRINSGFSFVSTDNELIIRFSRPSLC